MIGRKTSLAIVNLAVGVVLGLAAQKLIAIYFGNQPLGQVAYALGVLGILFFITDMGMGQAHVKRVSEGRHEGDCFATFAVFKLVSTLLFVVLVAGGLWFYMGVLGKTLETTTLPIIALVLVYYVAKSFQEIGQSSFEARLEMARLQATSFADTIVRVALTIAAALYVAALVYREGPFLGLVDRDGALAQWVLAHPGALLAAATTAGGVAAAVTALTMFLRIRQHGRFRLDLLKDYASFALPLFVGSAITAIIMNIDTAALGLFLNEAETGTFAGVRRIVTVLGGVAAPLGALLFPMFSGLMSRGDRSSVHVHMDQSIRYLSMFLAPPVIFTMFFAPAVIRLTLSDQFLDGAATMGILAAFVYVSTISGPHTNLLMGMGHPKLLVRIAAVTATSVVLFDVLLIPDDIRSLGIPLAGMGIEGAALGTLLSGVLYYVLVRYSTHKLAGYRERAHLWKHALGALLMGGALLALDRTLLPLVHWYHFGAYVLLGAAVYFGALVALREFTRADWARVRDSVHPIEMLRYVRDELRSKRE